MASDAVNRQFYSLPDKPELVMAVDETDDNFKDDASLQASHSKVPLDTRNHSNPGGHALMTSASCQGLDLLSYIASNVIGADKIFSGPYGLRKVTYLDYVASGKALKFIEDYIQDEVLPEYGNTHTTTSITSLQTTLFRHEARDIIRNACNASEHDSVIFCGSGTTGAVHKLIHGLDLKQKPIVFVSPHEHHSNILPWKEAGAEVIRIRALESGHVDIKHLEEMLQVHQGKSKQLIGAFSAASNVTGILTDVMAVTVCLHKYGALAFWDYATAAPYVKIDMNPYVGGSDQHLVYKDAVFFSMHKFVGGTSTPGVLIAKKKLFQNPAPFISGGGTVFFVRRESHRYLKEPEVKEEGGTPAIVESIRAGLVMQLKQAVGAEVIQERDQWLLGEACKTWSSCSNLVMLGPPPAEKLPVFSFLIYHPVTGRFLHHNFVAAILNDVFGIQARGGCACAGPYAMDLLGLEEHVATAIEELIAEDSRLDRVHLRRVREYSHREIIRPGFVRLNLPYFLDEVCLNFVLQAVTLVAEHAWKLLPQYLFNPETGEWRQRHFQTFKDRKWLGHISYQSGQMSYNQPKQSNKGPLPSSYQDCLEKAKEIFAQAEKLKLKVPDQTVMFDEEVRQFRWFVLPSEASACLQGNYTKQPVSPLELPFCPASLLQKLGYHKNMMKSDKSPLTRVHDHISVHSVDEEQGEVMDDEDAADLKRSAVSCGANKIMDYLSSASQPACNGQSEASQDFCNCSNRICRFCGKIIRKNSQISSDENNTHLNQQTPHSTVQTFTCGMIQALSQGFKEDLLYSSEGPNQETKETLDSSAQSENHIHPTIPSDSTNSSSPRWHNSFTTEDKAPSLLLGAHIASENRGILSTSSVKRDTQLSSLLHASDKSPDEREKCSVSSEEKDMPLSSGHGECERYKHDAFIEESLAHITKSMNVSNPVNDFKEVNGQPDLQTVAEAGQRSQLNECVHQQSRQQDGIGALRGSGRHNKAVPPTDVHLPKKNTESEKVKTNGQPVVATVCPSSRDKKQSSVTCAMKPRENCSPPAVGKSAVTWFAPPKLIFKPTVTAVEEYGMLTDGDRVLVCLSGGKDSMSLLHTIRQYQFYARAKGIRFEFGAVTVDPETPAYDPSPLKQYLAALGVPYFYESQCILDTAEKLPYECASICSFCSRMKRGRIYAAARREGYNVLALGQHLDDLAESFLMSFFHNGSLNTMKAHYTIRQGDLRVIRPFVYVREADLRAFAEKRKLPVIAENCPACFEAPKERHRTKQLLAAQEVMFPHVYHSMMAAMKPLMARNTVSQRNGHSGEIHMKDTDDGDERFSGDDDNDGDGNLY